MSLATTQSQVEAAEKLLASARTSLQAGNRDKAYHLSMDAARLNPDNIEAWLIRFSTAVSNEEKLLCLSQVVRINPDHPMAKHHIYKKLAPQLQKDPFLGYVEESEKAYIVRSTDYQFLAVPKDRSIPEPYPPIRPPLLSSAYRWLGLAVLGLVAAGIGTLLFAPLAIRYASDALGTPLQKTDKRRAWLILVLSIFLVGIALLLGWIFLAHLKA